MKKKYKNYRKNVLERVLKTAILAILSYLAVRLGIAGGNLLFSTDVNIIRNVHVESFKSTLNKAIPLIDTVYNSGNISISLSGEISNLIANIFNFNLDNPVTILNAQSPIMYNFYNNSYKEYLAQEIEKEKEKSKYENSDSGNTGDKPEGKTDEGTEPHEGPSGFLQDQSSIYYDGTDGTGWDDSGGNNDYNSNIAIKNESKYEVDDAMIEQLLKEELSFKFEEKGPQILIYHTHTSESYLRKLEDLGKENVPSRTQDSRYNVVRVGDELHKHLEKKYGFNVMHNGTINDYDYNDSYVNAAKTVDNILKGNPSLKVVIDLHRDGLDGVNKLRQAIKIDNKNAAQMFFVIGTNHENWKENFKLALKLHKYMNDKYPGLMLPILLRNARYNQQVSKGAFIIEIGGDGNTLDEAIESTKYLAEALNEVLGGMK
ncbi:stage II sporulation protein P [Clostridium thermosuccinogenes]|jgi:stage II sporulation protein P|uniref:stage II sporulation protein P n=1 Tax=Clostridium thermosuccinogenes TaxID=84032 RepID=UPI000CCC9DBE|nr:stage II sporulation protein P [Pseudoclostridium thermosuccinogenes]PNT93363.1 hypothetical protein CDQ83_07585 [Pseudoclostridium thermosuccinogenes]